ncbi:MAG: HAMP domain-containing histidine kinase [Deltaproteobacteria bacterium]|nr:HAMP domain-containing histidine kinase [Deltaproteobacteria bacterium]
MKAAPTPLRLWLRGMLAVVLIFAIGGAFLFSLESIILDLGPDETDAGRAQTLIFVPMVFAACVAWTTVLFKRVYSLLRDEPAIVAYHPALVLPADFVKGTMSFVLGACAMDLALQIHAGRVMPGLAAAMDALAIAESATLLLLGYVLMRRAVRPVLDRLPPGLADVPSNERLGRKLALAFAVPAATFALALALMSERSIAGSMHRLAALDIEADLAALPGLRTSPPPPVRPVPVGAGGLVLLATWLAAIVGGRLGRRVVSDLHVVTSELDSLAAGGRSERKPDRLAFREVRDLERAVTEVASRLDDLARAGQKSVEARAEAQRMKTQFLASMSHDLRSPLNSINGFSELLLRGVEGPLSAGQRESVQAIHKSGNDLLRLINDILDTAKLEAGRMDIQREWTPSVEILNETIKRSRDFVGDKEIELVAELQPGLPPVLVDADRISQAVLNVITNAFKFMEKGTVRVRARAGAGPSGTRGRYLLVEIADTGTGIREEDRESIFEAFRQVDASPSRRSGGMGLGLALARAIVELHGGTVWVESNLGPGSVFTLAVPIGE